MGVTFALLCVPLRHAVPVALGLVRCDAAAGLVQDHHQGRARVGKDSRSRHGTLNIDLIAFIAD